MITELVLIHKRGNTVRNRMKQCREKVGTEEERKCCFLASTGPCRSYHHEERERERMRGGENKRV